MKCPNCERLREAVRLLMQSVEYLAPIAGAGGFGLGYEKGKQALAQTPDTPANSQCKTCGATDWHWRKPSHCEKCNPKKPKDGE